MERPIDRPATMRLTMTNLAHLFNFKLFDNSTSGKWEASLYKWAIEPGGSSAVSLPSDANAIGIAGKEGIGGAPFAQMGPDMTEGYAGGTRGKNKRISLQYFPLQTGTKIQLPHGICEQSGPGLSVLPNTKTPRAGARRAGLYFMARGQRSLPSVHLSYCPLSLIGASAVESRLGGHVSPGLHSPFRCWLARDSVACQPR